MAGHVATDLTVNLTVNPTVNLTVNLPRCGGKAGQGAGFGREREHTACGLGSGLGIATFCGQLVHSSEIVKAACDHQF